MLGSHVQLAESRCEFTRCDVSQLTGKKKPFPAMLGFERLTSTIVWCCLVVANWFKAQFVHPVAEWYLSSVLGTWEESAKSLLRECSAQSIRVVNFVLNFLFGWFPGYQSTRATNEKPTAWQSWWAEDRQSTFNAIIDRERPMRGGTEGSSHQSRPEGTAVKAPAQNCSCSSLPVHCSLLACTEFV